MQRVYNGKEVGATLLHPEEPSPQGGGLAILVVPNLPL